MSETSQYLMGIHDRSARAFGVRYAQYLQALHDSPPHQRHRPTRSTPAQFLVRLEIKKIFERHFGPGMPRSLF